MDKDIAYFQRCITPAHGFKNTHHVIYHDDFKREYRVRVKLTERHNGQVTDERVSERFLFLDVHVKSRPNFKKGKKEREERETFTRELPKFGDQIRLRLWNVHKDDEVSVREVDVGVLRVYPGIIRPFEGQWVEDTTTNTFALILVQVLDDMPFTRSLCVLPAKKQKREAEVVDNY